MNADARFSYVCRLTRRNNGSRNRDHRFGFRSNGNRTTNERNRVSCSTLRRSSIKNLVSDRSYARLTRDSVCSILSSKWIRNHPTNGSAILILVTVLSRENYFFFFSHEKSTRRSVTDAYEFAGVIPNAFQDYRPCRFPARVSRIWLAPS